MEKDKCSAKNQSWYVILKKVSLWTFIANNFFPTCPNVCILALSKELSSGCSVIMTKVKNILYGYRTSSGQSSISPFAFFSASACAVGLSQALILTFEAVPSLRDSGGVYSLRVYCFLRCSWSRRSSSAWSFFLKKKD